jgi:predicted aminopeptidase
VFVGGVEAYSTLGWFRDPVLNTFIRRDRAGLAELLFHELAHQRVFLAGDTDFNEAFATAVAGAGIRRWLRAEGTAEALAAYELEQRREEEFVTLLQQTRTELDAIYAQTNSLPAVTMREQKAAAFSRLQVRYAALKQAWGGFGGYDGWFVRPLNNALLNTVETYHQLVPGFTALLARSGGDFEAFYRAVRQLGRLKQEERHRRLKALASPRLSARYLPAR